MKILTTIICFILFNTATFSQKKCDDNLSKDKIIQSKNFIYLSPYHFLRNTFQINYERLLSSNKTGILISGGFTFVDSYDDGKRGCNGEIHFRLYLNDDERNNKKNRLIYFSPYIRYQYIETTLGYYIWNSNAEEYLFHNEPDSYVNSYSGGILFGMKWIYQTRLTLDFYAGGAMKYSNVNGNQNLISGWNSYYGNYTGPEPKLGIQIGYNF